MAEWILKLKHYPHFDKPLPEEEIISIVTNPKQVAKNAFFPFIIYNKVVGRFGRKEKIRPIRYASRRDSYIFAYYRHILSKFYEDRLVALGIEKCPIAYRKIAVELGSRKGKCNIHFAKEGFEKIMAMGSCYAIAMDISSYFESLDHDRLEKLWCGLLDKDVLPPDHKAVFNNITKYTVVDLDKCYQCLGYIAEVGINGVKKVGYTLNPKNIPTQLCSPKDFRNKICGDDKNYPQLTEQNKNAWGIPQGSPISDLLANIYLLNFDKEMQDFASKNGAYYRRYSDDILLILPPSSSLLQEALSKVKCCINDAGEHLQVKDEKTNITYFLQDGNHVTATAIQPVDKQKPFEYLGFAFDGKTVKLRDSTVSKYYRKITFGIRKEAANLVARYQGKTVEEILELADISGLYQKYGRIEEFDDTSDYEEWNFWTYARRAADVMSSIDNIIIRQLRNHKKSISSRLKQEVLSHYIKRQPPTVSSEHDLLFAKY